MRVEGNISRVEGPGNIKKFNLSYIKLIYNANRAVRIFSIFSCSFVNINKLQNNYLF